MESGCSGMKFIQLFFEIVLLNLAILLVMSMSPLNDYMDILQRKDLYYLHANMALMFTFILYSGGKYYFTNKFIDRFKVLTFQYIIFIVVLLAVAEILRTATGGYSRTFILEYATIFYILKIGFFYLFDKLLEAWSRNGQSVNRVAILGVNKSGMLLGELLNNNPFLGCKLVGYVSDEEESNHNMVIGKLEDLSTLTYNHDINMIFVTDPLYFTNKNTKDLLALCNKIGLRVKYILMNEYWNEYMDKRVESAEFLKMFNPQAIPLDNIGLRLSKRLFDILFSLFVIVFVFSWLFPIIAIWIKLESKGPIFFVQKRTGINNKTFKCIKFRTMAVNKDCDTMQAQKNDSRVTNSGNILRRYNIDELPQFINVLKGEMSVVGPRPHMLKHTDQYSALIDHYKVRHFVKPGITGWAQVNGYRGLTDELWKMQKRVQYDMEYLEKWNFIWDIRIIILTVLGKDAYKNAM